MKDSSGSIPADRNSCNMNSNLSFASNDFLRQRHKKTTWILA